MSTYDAARIEKPAHFRLSPLARGRGKRAAQIIGFDSEQDTRDGRPMLFQFSRVGSETDTDLRVIPAGVKGAALDIFMTYLNDHCTRKDTEYIIVGWNLKYEFTQIFGDLPAKHIALDEYEISYEHRSVSGLLLATYAVRVMSDKRYGIVITNLGTKRRVRVMDGMAFFVTSLDQAGAMLGLGRKVEMASKKFTRADLDNPLFLQYARQDAYLTRKIGEEIIDLHIRFDVPTCITAPHFAARVFRRHFLNREIPLPGSDLEQAGLFAYHGGKNGYYLNGPKGLTNIWSYDITSAYPEAMRQLPDLENSEWHYATEYEPNVSALWCVTMRYKSCKWRGIMKHANEWHDTGIVENSWTTSYELDTALALGEVELISAAGWIMRGEPGGPLVKYVDTFFREKRETEGVKRAAAKLFLNSLYGKFFQKVPLGSVGYWDVGTLEDEEIKFVMTDPTQTYDWQAGGLYHPPLAALITGFVRAKIHRLEHKYGSVMTSTDGFFAVRKPDPEDIGDDLGKLTAERGHLSIWRERLYDFRPANVASKAKYALHGFRGKVDELRKIPLKPGAYTYNAQQVITNKLALKSYRGKRFAPGTFAILTFTLDLRARSP